MKRNGKYINLIFSVLLLAGLLTGVMAALLSKLEVNEYENRYAEKFAAFSFAGFLDGSFQDSVEAALGDRLPAAIIVKERYNALKSAYSDKILKLVRGANPDEEEAAANLNFKYIWTSSGMGIAYDHLLYRFHSLEEDRSMLDRRIENINGLIADYPGPEYYLYYIEKETDVNFETEERSGIREYIFDHIALPPDRKACYELVNFAQFHSYYYHSDHHWNYRGAYTAYKKIIRWMLPEAEPLVPLASWDVGTFSGSKAKGELSNYSDTMTVYEFEYPEMKIRINGEGAADYGSQSECIRSAKAGGQLSEIDYGRTYGWDYGEVVTENASGNGETILIFGDSFDNSIVKLLGAHFSKLVTIDIRNYEAQMGKCFDYRAYLDEYAPDRVLFIGNLDFFELETFNIK